MTTRFSNVPFATTNTWSPSARKHYRKNHIFGEFVRALIWRTVAMVELNEDPGVTRSAALESRAGMPDSWLDSYGDYLYQFALMRVRDAHTAEELVQETLLKGIAGFAKFRGESAVRTWLTQIMRNEISQHFRKHHRFPQQPWADGDTGPADLDALITVQLSPREFKSALERDEFWQMIWNCLEGTPPHLAQALILKLANDDQPIGTICEQMNISAANFSTRLFRARLLLRACIEKKWLNQETGSGIRRGDL